MHWARAHASTSTPVPPTHPPTLRLEPLLCLLVSPLLVKGVSSSSSLDGLGFKQHSI